MKSRISLIISIILTVLIVLSGAVVAEDSLAEIQKKGKIVLGLDDSFPPMGFRSEDGEIVGFDIDLAREVADRMGVELELKPVEWDGVILSLKNGMIDVIWNGLTITPEREKSIDFSRPYIANRQIIIVQDDSEIKNKSDLAGKVVGIQLGSSSVTAVESEPEVLESFKELRKFSNNTEALLDLQSGRVDAVVVDEIVGRYYMSKRPGQFKVLEENFGREEYGIGVRDGADSFRKALNETLEEMIEDGTAAEISEKWFGEDILLK
ncbi:MULTISPECIES: amino acid ABC transporter substrate-binding protein [unclassified Halanaerobium]|uniref:amino acid ABC transporter substrate-binding protein n=1 Tax=unclassified Halanaerobium TaxID=2641197 RepID=UPI000DF477F9|nr:MULTISPECIES: amino acid ABC transporter substrate-binding protein [unclassified Halanaerobium]RCW40916.1 amino acid ABC transporter substrate-binding protein (PAAT family) [Halanaerobium sp. MA284_MarDTE_T2]RCW79228.1 amino acid ABC transporter substrate-binding protein (PAAT family) [Halanaerobium sp. DL-01]